MVKTTNILGLCALVLTLACGTSADEMISRSRDGSLDVPNRGSGTRACSTSAYDSGWIATSVASFGVFTPTLSHNLGADPDRYLVKVL